MAEENPYDRASRPLARLAGVKLVCWLAGTPEESVRLVRPLETKLTVPGYPERIPDVLWHVTREDRHGEPWAALIEIQTVPDPLMPGRLLVESGLIWLQEKPTPLPGDRFSILPLVINLTGRGDTVRRMEWAAGRGIQVGPFEWNVQEEEAAAVLAAVERGAAPMAVLAWIPLMKGGGDAGIIAEWQRLAQAEPDAEVRAALRLTRVFAELAGCTPAWEKTLEGFDMGRSAVMDGWMAEAQAEALRNVLLARFGPMPSDLTEKLAKARSLDDVRKWASDVALAQSLDDFRQRSGL